MPPTVHRVLGPRHPELYYAKMIGSSSFGGCSSLVDGSKAIAIAQEDDYLEGPNLMLTDDESDVANDQRHRCQITDETVSLKPNLVV